MIRTYSQNFVKAGGVFTGPVPTPGLAPVTDPASGTPDALPLTALDGWHAEVKLNEAATFSGDPAGAFDVWLWTGADWLLNPNLEVGVDAVDGKTGMAIPDVPLNSRHAGQAVRLVPRGVTTSGGNGTTMTFTVRGRERRI
jgi:hypothetical protein